MIRGLYTAASGMISMERKQATLSNNLANVQTPGYKKDDTQLRAFPNLVLSRVQDYKMSTNSNSQIMGQAYPLGGEIGTLTTGVYAQERIPDFSQGQLVESSKPLDIAINDGGLPTQIINGKQVKSAAFFVVQLPDGSVGYTRDGNFDLDANNNLVTADGYRLLGVNNQPIQVSGNISMENVKVLADGRVVVNANNPAETAVAGQIGIVIAQNPLDLIRVGGNVFQTDAALPFMNVGQANTGVSLLQGFVEQSNVDSGQTITDMMTTVKLYSANQKVISAYDDTLQKLNSTGSLS